jgi:hypothetical protein
MKKFRLLLMLTVLTAMTSMSANAQITMYKSTDGYTVGTATFDTSTAASTKYFLTPLNSLNAATSGKYRIAVSYHVFNGAWTGKIIIQGRVVGSADSSWTNLNQVVGTTGINCDTLQVTASSTSSGWIFNAYPGMVTNLTANGLGNGATTTNVIQYSAAGRVTQIRVKIVGTTNSARIDNVRVLTAL